MNPKEAKIVIEYTYLRPNIRKNSGGVVGQQVSLFLPKAGCNPWRENFTISEQIHACWLVELWLVRVQAMEMTRGDAICFLFLVREFFR